MYVYTVEVVVVKIEKERHGKQATVANVKMDSVFSSLFTVPHAFLLPLLWLFEHIYVYMERWEHADIALDDVDHGGGRSTWALLLASIKKESCFCYQHGRCNLSVTVQYQRIVVAFRM